MLFILLQTSICFSEIFQLDSALNVRNSNTDFTNTDDVIGHVSAGTKFEVLSSKTLRSGAKALKIKIIKRGKGSTLSKKSEQSSPLYIYQGKNKKFTELSPNTTTEASATGSAEECANCASEVKQQMEEQSAVSFSQALLRQMETQASAPPERKSASADILQKIKNYENSPQVAETIRLADKRITRLKGTGKCYRETKKSLVKGGLLNSHPSDKYARNAANTLSKFGFVNLIDKPYNLNLTPDNAPKGSVLVFKSSRKCDRHTSNTEWNGCGDVTIKLGKDKFASDYKSSSAITDGRSGHKYELIGVMIKPNL
jgi:hypothetical protein